MKIPILLAAIFSTAISFCQNQTGKCPITITQLHLPYNHVDGASVPQAQVSFTNETAKRIARARFSLSILDAQATERPYDQRLTFTAGVDPGKSASSQWDLAPASIDIHHTGEIVYLNSIRFDDGTTWKDDGNLRCSYKVDYSAK